jgi:sodium/potassium/calcium exchanger 6
MSARTAKLLFVLVFIINCVLWSQSRFAEKPSAPGHALPGIFDKRDADLMYAKVCNMLSNLAGTARPDNMMQCQPSKVPLLEQCAHVQDVCPRSETVLAIPYTQAYFCTSPPLRPLSFAWLVLWLGFVFSTLGIAASDFFCPNLGTIADVFGLDENVAGVTLLAFGNGSPDMFSTFAAMRTHTASLALGELLGAATFITSVVVGSICIIKPFKADPYTFLRDIGFFSAAVALLQATLWDGRLYLWEALSMVALYLCYVFVVVCGTWWRRRREQRRLGTITIRTEFADDEMPPISQEQEPYRDEPCASLIITVLPKSDSQQPVTI